MAMTIKAYTFDKRRDSTKQPTGLTAEDISVVLKNPTSYKTPEFHLYRAGGFPFNYIQWEGWYYWITDVESVAADRYDIRCSMDVLATLRGWIMTTSAFVMYDTAANSELPDGRLSVNTSKSVSVNTGTFTNLGAHSFPGGTIVAGIVNDDGASFYAMDGTVADTLLSNVNSHEIPGLLPMPSISWDDSTIEDIVDGIAQIFDTIGQNFVIGLRHILGSRSAADCITSAKQVPVTVNAISGTTETIYLGTFNTGKSGKRITTRAMIDSATVSIPWQFSDWRRNAPYTELYLFLPYVGLITLSPGDLIGESSLEITASFDVISGDILFKVRTGLDKYIGQYGGNIAGPYNIGSTATSIGNQLVTAIGATAAGAATIATGGAAGAMAAKIGAAGVFGLIASNSPTPTTITSGGGGAALGVDATVCCISICHDTNVAPDSVSSAIGTPAMAVKTLGTLSGFVQTKCASVSAPFYSDIIEEVNNRLDGGVFIE